jgi:hypothetical protein
MAYSYTPKYFFSEELRRYVPCDPRRTLDLELDMPWQDRPLIRGRMLRDEILKKIHGREAREVVDYAKIAEPMVFATKDPAAQNGRGPDITLEKGRTVEVMRPSVYDQRDIDKKAEDGIQLVTIRWRGRTRLVHASMLFRSHEGAFKSQTPEET